MTDANIPGPPTELTPFFKKTCIAAALSLCALYVVFGPSSPEKSVGNTTNAEYVSQPSSKAFTFKVGRLARLQKSFYGCPEPTDLDKITALYRADDAEAAMKAAAEGNCLVLGGNILATMQHYSFIHGAICLRQRGAADCLWVPKAFVGSPDAE